MGWMMDYEPITKGLREYIERHPTMMHAVGLTDLLDNIDAIHRSLEQENERLRDASERDDDWTLDADGVPILANDELFWAQDGTSAGRVTAIGVGERAGWVWLLKDGSNVSIGRQANKVCHRKPDTWESIIEDATKLGFTDPDNEHLADKLVARCKALCERTREGEE